MDISATGWALGLLAGLLVGLTKTGLPGLGILVVPLMASIFPPKMSVGAFLPMLIFGDVFAVARYHRHAQWAHLRRLLPWVLPGMAMGAWVLRTVDEAQFRPVLGGLVLALLGLQQLRRLWSDADIPRAWWFSAVAGIAAGFATTVGNAAGAIMSVYLLSMDLPKEEFVGTGAWYYALVNWLKVPIYVYYGMINVRTLTFDAAMLPAIAVGALLGMWVLPRIPQKPFESTVWVLAAVAAVKLLLP